MSALRFTQRLHVDIVAPRRVCVVFDFFDLLAFLPKFFHDCIFPRQQADFLAAKAGHQQFVDRLLKRGLVVELPRQRHGLFRPARSHYSPSEFPLSEHR